MLVRRPFAPLKPFFHLSRQCRRYADLRFQNRPIPPPTPFVPDVQTFLMLIGRGLSAHASKINSWEDFFRATPDDFREKYGVEPSRNRKYLLKWRERFRQGIYGIGGDLQYVTDGSGEMKIFEIPVTDKEGNLKTGGRATANRTPGTRKVVLNVPHGQEVPPVPIEEAEPVKFVKIRNGVSIGGSHVTRIKGFSIARARICVKEGLWEIKRGEKVLGGERRKAQFMAKQRGENKRKGVS